MTNGCRIAGKCHRSLYPASFDIANMTLPETSIAAGNWWLEDYLDLFGIAPFSVDFPWGVYELQFWSNPTWAGSLTEPLKSYLPRRQLFQSSILWGYVSSRVCKACRILIYISLSDFASSHRFGSHGAGCHHFFYLFALSSGIFKGIVWGTLLTTYPPFAPGNTSD